MTFCTTCGARLAGAVSCPQCGAPVLAATRDAPRQTQDVLHKASSSAPAEAGFRPFVAPADQQPATKARGRRPTTRTIVGAGLLALVGVGAVFATQRAGSPEGGVALPPDDRTTDLAQSQESMGPAVAPPQPELPEASVLTPVSVLADCTAPAGVDSSGAPVTYDAVHVADGALDTAWRCPGDAAGVRLVLDFGRPVRVASVAVVPGYAKVDPHDGSDRFTQNRTVTAVDWAFEDGTQARQSIPEPQPAFAEHVISPTALSKTVVLVVVGTGNPAAVRDFTAISEVQVRGS